VVVFKGQSGGNGIDLQITLEVIEYLAFAELNLQGICGLGSTWGHFTPQPPRKPPLMQCLSKKLRKRR